MNDAAVGRTFFRLSLIADRWFDVWRFVTVNIYVFVVAEILVLIWGLVVALARMLPGPAGQPIRFLATLNCDVFRGLPAIITLYLIGFGIPTSGLPESIMPSVCGLFVNISAMTPGELRDLARIPVAWWCILALTPELVSEVPNIVRDLKRQGMTMLLATHEMGFAREVASKVCFCIRVWFMKKGRPRRFSEHPGRKERGLFSNESLKLDAGEPFICGSSVWRELLNRYIVLPQ